MGTPPTIVNAGALLGDLFGGAFFAAGVLLHVRGCLFCVCLRLAKKAYYVKVDTPNVGEHCKDEHSCVFLQWSAHGGPDAAARIALQLAGWDDSLQGAAVQEPAS
jgi:hypothetical protein